MLTPVNWELTVTIYVDESVFSVQPNTTVMDLKELTESQDGTYQYVFLY